MRARSQLVGARPRSWARSSTAPITAALMTEAVVMRMPACSSYQQPVRVSCTDAVTRWPGKSRTSEAENDAEKGVVQRAAAEALVTAAVEASAAEGAPRQSAAGSSTAVSVVVAAVRALMATSGHDRSGRGGSTG